MESAIEEAPPSMQWLTKALELARRHGVTFYDAVDHADQIINGCRFVIAERYVKKTAGSATTRKSVCEILLFH
jgi:hypothetical protein